MTHSIKMHSLAAFLSLVLVAPAALAATPAATPKVPEAKPIPAPSSAGIGKGDSEIGIFGNITSFDDSDLSLVILGASFGSFLSDSLELRVAPAMVLIDGPDLSSVGISTVVSGELLLRNGANPLVPFIGAGLGIDVTSIDAAGTSITNFALTLGPTGGIKYFLSERYSLELAASYLLGVGTSCGEVECFDLTSNTLQTTARFNFYY